MRRAGPPPGTKLCLRLSLFWFVRFVCEWLEESQWLRADGFRFSRGFIVMLSLVQFIISSVNGEDFSAFKYYYSVILTDLNLVPKNGWYEIPTYI